jgi:hypothetical protein
MPFSKEALILGGVFEVIGLLIIALAMYRRRTLNRIIDTPTSTSKQLEKLQAKPGNLPGRQDRIVEVKGMIKCDNPLRGDFSHKECVYFHAVQKERYRETYSQDGKTKTRTSYRTLSDKEDMRDFWVQDATGKVLVQPRSAEIEGEVAVNRFDRGQGSSLLGSAVRGVFGGVVGGLLGASRNTVEGVQYDETILPVNRRVYVLGELAVTGNGPVIRVPDSGGAFLISVSSEEDLISARTWTSRLLILCGVSCMGIGVFIAFALTP